MHQWNGNVSHLRVEPTAIMISTPSKSIVRPSVSIFLITEQDIVFAVMLSSEDLIILNCEVVRIV